MEIKFLVGNPQGHFSSKPRSIVARANSSASSEIEKKSPTLAAAISGARLAANQFSKKNQSQTHDHVPISTRTRNGGGVQALTYRKKEVQTLLPESHVNLPCKSDVNGINEG